MLVYYEIYDNIYNAISREKQLKSGSRDKKIELINNFNREWKDLLNYEIYWTGDCYITPLLTMI